MVVETEDVLDRHPTALGIACDVCALEYSLDDYQILKNNKKLIYFSFTAVETTTPFLTCHECFFKYIKKIAAGKEIKLTVLTRGDEITLEFIPSELFGENGLDAGNDDYLGLF